LGFDGYYALREASREDVPTLARTPSRVEALQDGRSHTLEAITRLESEALLRIPQFVSQADLDAAAATLLGARQVLLAGNHYAAELVAFLERRLRRLGFTTVAIRSPGQDVAEKAMSLAPDDVVIGFALRTVPRLLPPLVRYADSVDVKSIVITDLVGAQLQPVPTHLLAAPRAAEESARQRPFPVSRTLSVPMTICYALQQSLLNQAPDRFSQALERLDQAYLDFDVEGGSGTARGAQR
jgi:DNA-binding MurR/RpiR family transcriptional regulator